MTHASRRLTAEGLIASKAITGREVSVDQARAILAASDPADPRDRTRRLLILAESLLAHRPGRRDRNDARQLLTEARATAEETSDNLLRAAVAFASAELELAGRDIDLAAAELRDGLRVLSRIDHSLGEQISRARFIDTVEPVTRRALRTAAAIGDARSRTVRP